MRWPPPWFHLLSKNETKGQKGHFEASGKTTPHRPHPQPQKPNLKNEKKNTLASSPPRFLSFFPPLPAETQDFRKFSRNPELWTENWISAKMVRNPDQMMRGVSVWFSVQTEISRQILPNETKFHS